MIRTWLGLAASLALAGAASAHQAPSGWRYDNECCNDTDCRPIPNDAVMRVPGGWRIVATGQVFTNGAVKHSPDGHFHRCSAYGREDTYTYCLYVPDLGT